MRSQNLLARSRRSIVWEEPDPAPIESSLRERLDERLVGQPVAVETILPYVQMFQAGLAPEGRPAGVFLLLGPTGTGKTRTVEALAAALHGSEKSMLKVDCGEFQMEHEVAKLVGAPPGYLGHRETPPMLSQQKLNTVSSEKSSLSIVLFDEIEKAASSMTRLLLGILDKATLRLGDNNCVNFERTLIFLTSNLGARGMAKAMAPGFGFSQHIQTSQDDSRARLTSIGMNAVRRKFTPEFVNRIDAVITYQPLSPASMERILGLQLGEIERHIENRLGDRAFRISVPEASRAVLLRMGTSLEFGVRELKRILHRNLMQPLAALIAEGRVQPGATVTLDPDLRLRIIEGQTEAA